MQIFRLLIARMKMNQTPYVIFRATIQFSFKFSITLPNFLAETLYALDKKSP